MATSPKNDVPKNPPPLPAGMDNPWYDYSPYPKRPLLAWPRNARVGWFVLLHLEYWELIPDETSLKDPRHVGELGSFTPDYRTWTQRDYGNRVGIFRVLDVLDRYQIRAGAAAGFDRPQDIDRIVAAHQGPPDAFHAQPLMEQIHAPLEVGARDERIAPGHDRPLIGIAELKPLGHLT